MNYTASDLYQDSTQLAVMGGFPVVYYQTTAQDVTALQYYSFDSLDGVLAFLRDRAEGFYFDDNDYAFCGKSVNFETMHGHIKSCYKLFSPYTYEAAKNMLLSMGAVTTCPRK